MAKKTFVPKSFKLSERSARELYEGSLLIRQNAHDLIESARKLGRAKLYGPANSLAILAAEECIKYFAVAAVGAGLEIPDDMTFQAFRHHDSKHMVGFFITYLKDFLDQTGLFDRDRWFKRSARKGEEYKSYLLETVNTYKRRFEERDFSEAQLWWKFANQRKNDGLYVDVQDEVWTSPKQVTMGDLKLSLKQAERLLGIVDFFGKELSVEVMELCRKIMAEGKMSGDMLGALERHYGVVPAREALKPDNSVQTKSARGFRL